MDRRRLARPRARRQLFPQAMAAGLVARRIQAAARGFLARRRLQRQRRGLMSPADVRAIKRKKGNPGQVRVPAVFPKYRIGSLVGTDVSKRTVRKTTDNSVVKVHYDYNHSVAQTQVAYFGFYDAGSLEQQMEIGCTALAQFIYKKSGICVPHADYDYTQTHTHTQVSTIRQIKIGFVETKTGAVGNLKDFVSETISNGLSTGTTTLNGLRDAIKDACVAHALNAEWPYVLTLLTQDFYGANGEFSSDRIVATYDLSQIMIKFDAVQKYKYQNVTPATDGGTNVNDVSANPLSGKMYRFKGMVPKLRPIVQDAEAAFPLDKLPRIEETVDAQGILQCQAFRETGLYNAALKPGFRQPFKANAIFKNVTHEDKVYMPPGGYKQAIHKTSVTMNFKRFIQATTHLVSASIGLGNETRVPNIGNCVLWAFEPAVRTAANEVTKMIVNRELWLKASAKHSPVYQNVRSMDIVAAGNAFGTI